MQFGDTELLPSHILTCLGSGLASCILSQLDVTSLFHKSSLLEIVLKQKNLNQLNNKI